MNRMISATMPTYITRNTFLYINISTDLLFFNDHVFFIEVVIVYWELNDSLEHLGLSDDRKLKMQ